MSDSGATAVRVFVRPRLAAAAALVGVLAFGAAPARAGAGAWCDDGSPPPNDFRVHQTGVASAGSTPGWLRSTDNPEVALNADGSVSIAGVQELTGGVAIGMAHAANAPGKST